jgi:translation initiation factor IF-1
MRRTSANRRRARVLSERTCERSEHVSESKDRTAEGIVLELLPSQLVRVELDGRHIVTAHLASPVGRNYVRVIVGDRVRVQLMSNDPSRARIVEKL